MCRNTCTNEIRWWLVLRAGCALGPFACTFSCLGRGVRVGGLVGPVGIIHGCYSGCASLGGVKPVGRRLVVGPRYDIHDAALSPTIHWPLAVFGFGILGRSAIEVGIGTASQCRDFLSLFCLSSSRAGHPAVRVSAIYTQHGARLVSQISRCLFFFTLGSFGAVMVSHFSLPCLGSGFYSSFQA